MAGRVPAAQASIPGQARAEAVLQSRIVPFGRPEAALAAELFNQTGRRRGSRFDCLVAATAIIAQAEVATVNKADFQAFAPHGLKLAAPPSPAATIPQS